MFTTARQKQHTRERLDTCLAELNQKRPTVLLHEDVLGRNLSFRAGLPCFERTLELFHRLSRCYLDHVPLADLKNITDDAANTLDQFRKILNFTGDNVENPREARDLLIYDVDASFPRISANFATVVSQPPRRRDVSLLRRVPLSRSVFAHWSSPWRQWPITPRTTEQSRTKY
jgi:hypothetical protein